MAVSSSRKECQRASQVSVTFRKVRQGSLSNGKFTDINIYVLIGRKLMMKGGFVFASLLMLEDYPMKPAVPRREQSQAGADSWTL